MVDHASLLDHSFLLLGAGASADAKVPMAAQFIGSIRNHLASSELGSKSSRLLARAFDEVTLALKDSGRDVSLEPVYELIDDALDAHFAEQKGIAPLQSNTLPATRQLERLRYEIKRVIQSECAVNDIERARWIEPLLLRLADFSPFPIVSFNYDSILETVSAGLGLEIAESVLGEERATADLELIKVHGSVTWQLNRKGSIERNLNYSSSIMKTFGELRSPILETPLIYPSRKKMPLEEPFMKNALRLLELLDGRGHEGARKNCIVVGYSFPDAHVRSWLARAMRSRPDLRLILVGPSPKDAIVNLVDGIPGIDWSERLLVLQRTFKEAIGKKKGEFEDCLRGAVHFGEAFETMFDTTWRRPAISTIKNTTGLCSSLDGRFLYASSSRPEGRILRYALDRSDHSAKVVAKGLKDPRGLAQTNGGALIVVENRLFRNASFPGRGMGTVVSLDIQGDRSSLLPFRLRDLKIAVSLFRQGRPTAEIWSRLPSLLRWPTDVAVSENGSIYVTEARSLARLTGGSAPERVFKHELMFNLHAIDVADDEAILAVEGGVAGQEGWGRLWRIDMSVKTVSSRLSMALDGMPNLGGVSFIPFLRKVVVAQSLPWPRGRLFILNYPHLDDMKVLGGFNFPRSLAYIPEREELAIGVKGGICIIEASDLVHAVLPAHGELAAS